MPPNVNYGQVEQLLLGMGFEKEPGEHLVFRHSGTAALLRLAMHEADETVLQRDLVKVRALLDREGLLDGAAFDQWLLKTSRQPAVG